MAPIKVAIVGGGPAGIVTLKTLLEASTPEQPIEARVFEAEKAIGGTFKYRAYQNAELVSSKQLTMFSDYRLPLSAPDHVSLPRYVEYLQDYIDHFKLQEYINLGCRVSNICQTSEGKSNQYRIEYSRTGASGDSTNETFEATHLAICTGLHVTPSIPTIPGFEENFQGQSFHSSQYQGRSQLEGQDVLILGCGETAMDVAYESIKANAKSVTMCFRTGFLSFPKVLNRFRIFGRSVHNGTLPIDGLITNLFETAYVNHHIRESRLRSIISDKVIKRVVWFLTGTQEGCNQHVGALPNEILGRSYVFLNKSHRAMPYLNRPHKHVHPFLRYIGNEYIDPPEDAASDRYVDTCSFPQSMDKTGRITFVPRPDRKDYRRLKDKVVRPSLIVYCTGYRQEFSWIDAALPRANEANVRNIIKAGRPDIAFIGFVRPGVGAIPPIAEQQAMWWTALILGKMREPRNPGHYKLLTRNNARIEYGVDYSTYMAILAQDFGGAPGLLELWREHGFKMLMIYCFGASFVSFYRLVGPFKSAMAPEVARVELLDTIMRRGVGGNFFFGVVPMLFYGVLNALAYLLEAIGLLSAEKESPEVDAVP